MKGEQYMRRRDVLRAFAISPIIYYKNIEQNLVKTNEQTISELQNYKFANIFHLELWEDIVLLDCNKDGSPKIYYSPHNRIPSFHKVLVAKFDLQDSRLKGSLSDFIEASIEKGKKIYDDFDPAKDLYIVLIGDGTIIGLAPYRGFLRLEKDVIADFNNGILKCEKG